jgi:HTH-type transcriptional repressor of NAD biosynthesis genes
MFAYFKDTLEKYQRPYVLLSGGKKERLAQAVSEIDRLLAQKK